MAAVASLPMGPDRVGISLRKRVGGLNVSKKRLLHSNGTPELAGYLLIQLQGLQPPVLAEGV